MDRNSITQHIETEAVHAVSDILRESANRCANAAAILAPGRPPFKYGALFEQAGRIGAQLRSRGIAAEDRVALALPNGPDMASGFLSIAAVAGCAPLNPTYRKAEFEFYLADLHASALVLDEDGNREAEAAAQNLGVPILRTVCGEYAGEFHLAGEGCDGAGHTDWANHHHTALLLHTSGTTARPKLVPLTGANLAASARNIAESLALTPVDRCLNIMPLFHVHGLIAAVLATVKAGGSVICTDGVYGADFFNWMRAFRPTWYTAVPTMHQALASLAAERGDFLREFPLRLIRSSSAALAPQLLGRLENVFAAPVIEAYGMTEAAHQMASNPLPPGVRKPGFVGRAAGPEIAIMDEGGQLLGEGATGEVVIRGDNVTHGYEANEAANRAAFTGGWFRTGDEGVIDADGYLRLTGRLKEQINRGGQKIAPREIDEVLLGHPQVKQAVAFAIPHAQLGEEVGAAVELTTGTGVDASVVDASVLDLSVLREWAGARLATYKVPRIILQVDEIPKGPTGKVQRIGLAQRLGIAPMDDAQRQAAFTLPRNSLEERIAAVWRQMLGRDDIGVLDRFEAVGGDSLLAVGMLVAVGAAEGVDLPYLRFLTEGTIESLAKEIEAGKTQPASLLVPVQPRGNRAPQNQQHRVEREVHRGLTPDDRLKSAFRRGLALPGNFDASSAEADRTRTWDSVGHLQLVLALEDEFGIRLDPTDVIELKSYLDAKAILKRRGRWKDEIGTANPRPVSLLIPIQGRGSRPPLIWFPGHDRLFSSALRLSAALGEDQPVWAMDIMRMRGASSLEELAAACGSALLQQPELGPWRLAGHCFGGLLAFESALFLEAAGARVDRLILVDALNPAWCREQKWSAVAAARWGEYRARLAYHTGVLRSGTNRSRYLYLRERAAAFFKGRSEHLVPSGVVGQHRAFSSVWKPRPWKGQALIVREPGRRLEAPALGWNGVIRELREEVVPFYRTGPLAVERISILKGILERYLDRTPAI